MSVDTQYVKAAFQYACFRRPYDERTLCVCVCVYAPRTQAGKVAAPLRGVSRSLVVRTASSPALSVCSTVCTAEDRYSIGFFRHLARQRQGSDGRSGILRSHSLAL